MLAIHPSIPLSILSILNINFWVQSSESPLSITECAFTTHKNLNNNIQCSHLEIAICISPINLLDWFNLIVILLIPRYQELNWKNYFASRNKTRSEIVAIYLINQPAFFSFWENPYTLSFQLMIILNYVLKVTQIYLLK